MESFKIALSIILIVGGLGLPGWAGQPQNHASRGVPNDWSHHRLIFSKPRSVTQLQQLQRDPRYQMQQGWRNGAGNSAAAIDAKALQMIHSWGHPIVNMKTKLKKDWSVSMGSGTQGIADVYPAKYGFASASGSCSDYVVFPTSSSGSNDAPSVIAYTNLYDNGCNTGSPTQYWALNLYFTLYHTSAATSPVISDDGEQVAFVATTKGDSISYLVVALMPTITSTSTTVTSVNATTCLSNTSVNSASQGTSPVVWCAMLRGSGDVSDSNSSPFYDYTNNVLYVGDDSGALHRFENIFHSYNNGLNSNTTAPSEPLTVGFPKTIDSGAKLTSPVFDSVSNNVFVGDTNGYLSRVNVSSANLVKTTTQLSHGAGIVDGPIVDSSAKEVYVFLPDDQAAATCSSGSPCTSVRQFSTSFSASDVGTIAIVGAGSGSTPVYDGALDNNWFNNGTGNLYVCGNAGGKPTLYQVPITSGAMGTSSNSITSLTSASTTCSPVTEFYNPNSGASGVDWLFMSVEASGNLSPCAGACVYSFNANTSTPAVNAGIASTGGSSGIIVDNAATTPAGSSQVYFETIGATNAVQAAQSGL